MNSPHTLSLMSRSLSGDESWECTECDRHLIVNWNPGFRSMAGVTVLNVLDETGTAWLKKAGITWP